MKYLVNFGTDWGFIPDGDSVSFIDTHGEIFDFFDIFKIINTSK